MDTSENFVEDRIEIGKSIVESTAKTIINYNFDISVDLAEIGIDSLLEESLFKEIPIVKTIYGITKTGFAIREKHMLKKTLMFISQLNNNNISNQNYQAYIQKLKSNDKNIFKELEYVLVIIDRYIEINKNNILANLYFNYVDKKITWEQFQELSIIIDNIFLVDLTELENIYYKQSITMNDIKNKISFRRLKTQNLVEDIETTVRTSSGNISHYYIEYDYRITELGNILYKYGLNK